MLGAVNHLLRVEKPKSEHMTKESPDNIGRGTRDALALLEPMYSLRLVCEYIPMTLDALDWLLRTRRDEFPPRYHYMAHEGPGGKVRMLTLSEYHRIREIVITNRTGYKKIPRSLQARQLDLVVGEPQVVAASQEAQEPKAQGDPAS